MRSQPWCRHTSGQWRATSPFTGTSFAAPMMLERRFAPPALTPLPSLSVMTRSPSGLGGGGASPSSVEILTTVRPCVDLALARWPAAVWILFQKNSSACCSSRTSSTTKKNFFALAPSAHSSSSPFEWSPVCMLSITCQFRTSSYLVDEGHGEEKGRGERARLRLGRETRRLRGLGVLGVSASASLASPSRGARARASPLSLSLSRLSRARAGRSLT